MIRYYCSGFDPNNAFNYGLGKMFKDELENTKSIVYIPSTPEKLEKVKNKYIPNFRNYFNNVGINFEQEIILSFDTNKEEAKKAIQNASFILLMGGDPFKQKNLCEKLDIVDELKNYNGIMLGISAGAMVMSKYIIIIPCSEEYPNFHIEKGLNLDDISISPHNNTNNEEYPNILDVGDETYQKQDLIKVAKDYGEFYLLQNFQREDGFTDVSIIKSTNGIIEQYIENEGKIWLVSQDDVLNINNKKYKSI